MNIYIFLTESCRETAPAIDRWNNWKDPDTTKLAHFAMQSWQQYGWTPKRYTTLRYLDNVRFTGRLKDSPYTSNRWANAWAMAELAPAWFTTIDVFSRGLTPGHCAGITQPLSICRDTFSMACIFATPGWCRTLQDLIHSYDAGILPMLNSLMVSDETIARAYLRTELLNQMRYSHIDELTRPNALVEHYPRSVLPYFPEPCN